MNLTKTQLDFLYLAGRHPLGLVKAPIWDNGKPLPYVVELHKLGFLNDTFSQSGGARKYQITKTGLEALRGNSNEA